MHAARIEAVPQVFILDHRLCGERPNLSRAGGSQSVSLPKPCTGSLAGDSPTFAVS